MHSLINSLQIFKGVELWVENKANLIQIKKLQGDVVSLMTKPGNMQVTKKILEEKDNTIQVLKKKLKVPNAEHVQSS